MKYRITILLGILLLLGACKIEKPSLPVWDILLKVPLINEHYYVSELLDNIHFVVDENELLHLTTQGEIETRGLDMVTVYPDIVASDLPISSGINVLHTFAFEDMQGNAALSYGEVASGEIKIRIDNIHPDAGEWRLGLDIPTIIDAQGHALHLEFTSATAWQSIDLSSLHFGVLDSEEPVNELDLQLSSSSALPDGSALAQISLEINRPITFRIFQGRLDFYEVFAIDSASSLDIEYPLHLEEAITLTDAFIEIEVSNQIAFSCEFVGWLKATRGDTVFIIPIVDDDGNNYRIEASSVDNPTHLIFRNRISEFVQIMPDHVEVIDVKFIIDSASGFGTVRNTDIIHGHYTVLAPFRFYLHDSPISIDNPTKISISEENRQQISDNVLEACFSLKVLNTIPIGATAIAYFSLSEAIDPEDPATYSFVKQMALGSAQSHPGWQDLEPLSLSKAELDIFSAPDVFLKWVFHFEESDGLVEVHAGLEDFIWLKGQILASLRVDDL